MVIHQPGRDGSKIKIPVILPSNPHFLQTAPRFLRVRGPSLSSGLLQLTAAPPSQGLGLPHHCPTLRESETGTSPRCSLGEASLPLSATSHSASSPLGSVYDRPAIYQALSTLHLTYSSDPCYLITLPPPLCRSCKLLGQDRSANTKSIWIWSRHSPLQIPFYSINT